MTTETLSKLNDFMKLINAYIKTGRPSFLDAISDHRKENPKAFHTALAIKYKPNTDNYKGLEVMTRPAGFNG